MTRPMDTPGMPTITSGKIRLREFALTDAQALFETVYGDAEVMRFVAGGPHKTVANTEAAIKQYIAHTEQHGFTFWGVENAETGELLGDCGLYFLEGRGPEVEFGVTLCKSSWGAGLGSMCARACLAHAFDHIGLSQVIAVARPENLASTRLLNGLGFSHTGVVDVYGGLHERFQIDAASWRDEPH